MRFRWCRFSDLQACRSLLSPVYGENRQLDAQLPRIWKAWLADRGGAWLVIEDEDAAATYLQGFLAVMFVRPGFAPRAQKRAPPALAVYESALSGQSPVLSYKEVRSANTHASLTAVVLHLALRDAMTRRQRHHAMQVASEAIYFSLSGYRIDALLCDEEAQGRTSIGASASTPADGMDGARAPGFLAPSVLQPLSFLFCARRPKLGFSPAQQLVLNHALLGATDAEIARELGISNDAIKQTWRGIYQRVSCVAPHWFTSDKERGAGTRGAERKRRLLERLRHRLEELRPYDFNARSSEGRLAT
jgi:DNA-binding NarL/FixJ family response regulator